MSTTIIERDCFLYVVQLDEELLVYRSVLVEEAHAWLDPVRHLSS